MLAALKKITNPDQHDTRPFFLLKIPLLPNKKRQDGGTRFSVK